MGSRLLLLLLLALAFTACSLPRVAIATPSPALSAFVGMWSRHGVGLTVVPDGSFDFEWRTYRPCGEAAPPCDQIVNDVITGGGRAIGTMHAVAQHSATGRVTASNDPTYVRSGSFSASVTDYELLTLKFGSRTVELCGRDFAARAPARLARSLPCGP